MVCLEESNFPDKFVLELVLTRHTCLLSFAFSDAVPVNRLLVLVFGQAAECVAYQTGDSTSGLRARLNGSVSVDCLAVRLLVFWRFA